MRTEKQGFSWDRESDDYMKRNYPFNKATDISKKLNRSIRSVYSKASRMGLKKKEIKRTGDVASFNINLFDTFTAENCYFLGYLFADGWIYKRSKYSFDIGIELKDHEMIKKFSILTESNRISKHRKNLQLILTNYFFAQKMLSLGFNSKKTRCSKIPKIPKQYKKDFIRGYFDGDGHIFLYHDKRSLKIQAKGGISSINKKILNEIGEFLNFGNIYKNENTFILQFGKRDSIKFYELLYYPGCLCLDRKRITFEELLNAK